MSDDWGNDPIQTGASPVKASADDWGNDPVKMGVAPTSKPAKDFSDYDIPYVPIPSPSLPMENAPGVHRGTILPFASDDKGNLITTSGGWPRLYVPEILRSPIRGATAGGQEALGQRPVDDPSVRGDVLAATSFGAGSAPAGVVKSVALPPEPIRPLYEFVSRITGEDISKNVAAQRIVKRMEQDQSAGGPSAQDMIDLLNATPGKPLTAADVGGENTLALAGNISRSPGQSRQMITDWLNKRDRGAGPRLDDDITRALGDEGGQDAFQALIKSRSGAAKPLFEKAYDGGSVAPLERQFEGAFDAASVSEKQASQEVADTLSQLTAAQSRKPTTGGNVYSESSANDGVRAAQSAVDAARSRLAAAQTEKGQVLDMLRTAQDDISTGKPGAVWNPRVQEFLGNPRIKQGISRGLRIERDNALAEGRSMNPTDYAIIGQDADGEPIVGKVPTMRLLAVAKEGLDRMLQSDEFRNSLTGELNKEGVAIDKMRAAFLGELDKLNPTYKAARAQWGGDSQSLQSFKLGEKILKTNPREIQAAAADMTQNDREFFRLGAARALRDEVAKKGITGDEAKAIIRSDYTRSQLRPLFDNDVSYERFINGVEAEGRMFGTRFSVLGGSPTARRSVEDTTPELDAAGYAARTVKSVAEGSWMRAMSHAMDTIRSFGQTKDPAINAEIARFLSTDLSEANAQGRMKALKELLNALGPAKGVRSQYASPEYRGAIPFMTIHASPLTGATAGNQPDPTLSGATNGIPQ